MAKKQRVFIKQFWKDKQMVGAISASSKYLGEKMIKNIDFSKDKVIVELGPGTGVFTDLLIDKLADDAILFVFELNDLFFEKLAARINDKRVVLIHDTAENIAKHLNEHGYEKADIVLSSLPLAMFTKELRDSVLIASKNNLKQEGTYIQFQYSLQARSTLKKLYKTIKISWTPLNVPPAFVYACKN
ncbi:MAG: phospholipid methyltransferase [Bacteroidota bacterium]